jgi:hypothetical protein
MLKEQLRRIGWSLAGGLVGVLVLAAWLSWSDAQPRVGGRRRGDPIDGWAEMMVRLYIFFPMAFIAGAAAASFARRRADGRGPRAKDEQA